MCCKKTSVCIIFCPQCGNYLGVDSWSVKRPLYSNVHVVHRHEPLGQVVRPQRWKVRVHQEMLAHKA